MHPRSRRFGGQQSKMNSQHDNGIPSSEVNFKTRISADLSTLVTTLAPLKDSSTKCQDQILTKTLLVPIIDLEGRVEITLKNGRMYPRYGNGSEYYIISKDAVMSKETQFLGKKSHIIGWMCTVDSSVNAPSTPSPDALFEVFSLQFNGSMILNEMCPHNGSITLRISSPATIKLPVVCSVQSEKFSCGAVTLRSAETKEVHVTHHRIIVHQEDNVEKEV